MHINFNTLKTFLFVNSDIVYQRISLFFIIFISIIANITKIPGTFKNIPNSNANSYTYVAKQKQQALLKSKSNNKDSKTIGFKSQILEYKIENSYIR